MQGAVISGSLDSTLYGTQGVEAVLTVGNGFETSGSNQSLPALRVEGEKGLELSGFPGAMAGSGIAGTIYSDLSDPGSDLIMNSRDSVYLYLDAISDDSTAIFGVTAGNGQYICNMNEDGDLDCRGTITGATLRTAAEVDGDTRALYGVQSPQAWLEDFGTAQLRDGTAFVKLEALFAKAIQADSSYHVFLTPLGETQGLYVAKKTPTGFEVREQGGGTSDIAFDYRIVAQPAGDTGRGCRWSDHPPRRRREAAMKDRRFLLALGLGVTLLSLFGLSYAGQQSALNAQAAALPANSAAPAMESAHFGLDWDVVGAGGSEIASTHFGWPRR
jgi:hypothetical protein